MTHTEMDAAIRPLNPFATRRVRPGALRYVAPRDFFVGIARRFSENRYRGALIGPHGSGKTTLLCELARRWRSRFRQIRWITIQRTGHGIRVLAQPVAIGSAANDVREPRAQPDRELWIVDGYDALRRLDRICLAAHCRRGAHALLVTAHAPQNLPTLAETNTSLDVFLQLATTLQSHATQPLAHGELRAIYQYARGNLRESFFDAFDAYRKRRPPAAIET